jgi:hypothetical protein
MRPWIPSHTPHTKKKKIKKQLRGCNQRFSTLSPANPKAESINISGFLESFYSSMGGKSCSSITKAVAEATVGLGGGTASQPTAPTDQVQMVTEQLGKGLICLLLVTRQFYRLWLICAFSNSREVKRSQS